jgi:iron complex outermembrane receptor protein
LKSILRCLSVLLFCFLLGCTAALAQTRLYGLITDAGGMPVRDVMIAIPDLKADVLSDANGNYLIINIPVGKYLVQVSGVGYATIVGNINIKGSVQKNFTLQMSNRALKEIVITGVSAAAERNKNPVPVGTLSKQVFLENPAGNIIDAITVIPGVSAITEGPAISKPVVRGLGYNRLVVINDGVRQEGNQWGDEFGIEVDENTVARVEVLKGPGSLRYGSDAMAGVINFLGPLPVPDGQVSGSLLNNYQANNGLWNESLNVAGNYKGFIWDFTYTYKRAHNYQNKYDGYVWNSAYGENDVKGTVGIQKRWGHSTLTLSLFDLKLGIIEGARDSATGRFSTHYLGEGNTDSLGIVPSGKNTVYNYYPIIHQHVRHYKAVWDNSVQLGNGLLQFRLGLQQNYRQEANDITAGDVYNNYFFLRTINYDVQYLLPQKNNWRVSFGVNGMKQNSEDRGTVYLVPEYNLFDAGVFSIAQKTWNKLTVSGGLRFDSRDLNTSNLYTDSAGVRVTNPNNSSVRRFAAYHSNFSGVSGSLGLAYDFTRSFYGKLNFSRGFRAPNIAESGSNGIHDGTPFYEIGDPNLKPESSFQADVTLGLNNENVTAELNVFRNRINNYIFPVKLASINGGDSVRTDEAAHLSGQTFKYVSGDAVLSGGEIMVDIHPAGLKFLHFENSFSTVSAIQLNADPSTKYLPYTPPSKYQSKLKIIFKGIAASLTNTYFMLGLDHYFEQDKIYYKFGNETITPAYNLVNMGIGSDIVINKHTAFSLYIYGANLFDEAYQSNMSRLKYADVNNITGRTGVYNMGRNLVFKIIIPFGFTDR